MSQTNTSIDHLFTVDMTIEDMKDFGRDFGIIDLYCKTAKVELKRIDVVYETGERELMYFFNDNLGGYTMTGIVLSLNENKGDHYGSS